VEIPKIFGSSEVNGPPGQIRPEKPILIPLLAEPKSGSKTVAQIGTPTDVVSREHGYESESAVAFERRNGWTLIQSKSGRGWLSPENSGTFRSYESLVHGSVYLTGDWDLKLYASPHDLKSFETIPSPQEDGGNYPSWQKSNSQADVLTTKVVDGQLWFQIQLIHGRCSENEKLGKKGWVPGYSRDGSPTLWFHSRGC